MCGPWTMTPWLQQSAPRGRVGSTRGEYQQLLRHHKAQRRPQQPSLQMNPAHQRPQLAVEFHRSAATSIPAIRERVNRNRCRSGTQQDPPNGLTPCSLADQHQPLTQLVSCVWKAAGPHCMNRTGIGPRQRSHPPSTSYDFQRLIDYGIM